MSSGISDPRLARLAQAYEALRRDNLPALLSLYAEQALFKDPFNEVRGHAAIQRVFAHMFEQLDRPRFAVSHGAVQGDSGFLLWELGFVRASGQPMHIDRKSTRLNSSHLVISYAVFCLKKKIPTSSHSGGITHYATGFVKLIYEAVRQTAD